jgi:hypothetical protein
MALILAVLLLLITASASPAQDRVELARVRLTTDPKVPVGCTTLGTVKDDSVKDLRRKIVRLGGDTALLSFPTDDLARVNAIVFRCPPVSAAAPPKSSSASAPAVTPHAPPPPGLPPPPPPPDSAPAPR